MHKTIWGILYGPYGVCLFRCGSLSFRTSLQLIALGAGCSDLLSLCSGLGVRVRFALTAVRFVLTAVRFVLTAVRFVLTAVRFALTDVRFVGARLRFVGILSDSFLSFRDL